MVVSICISFTLNDAEHLSYVFGHLYWINVNIGLLSLFFFFIGLLDFFFSHLVGGTQGIFRE